MQKFTRMYELESKQRQGKRRMKRKKKNKELRRDRSNRVEHGTLMGASIGFCSVDKDQDVGIARVCGMMRWYRPTSIQALRA